MMKERPFDLQDRGDSGKQSRQIPGTNVNSHLDLPNRWILDIPCWPLEIQLKLDGKVVQTYGDIPKGNERILFVDDEETIAELGGGCCSITADAGQEFPLSL